MKRYDQDKKKVPQVATPPSFREIEVHISDLQTMPNRKRHYVKSLVIMNSGFISKLL
jgi:hypothetical protein